MMRALEKIGFALTVLVLVSPAATVFLWMLSLSLKNELDNTAWPPVFIPSPPVWDNFIAVFERNDFLLYTWNSVVVSFTATGLAILIGVPAGYGIAKMRATRAAMLILIARITPGLSYLIPLFLLFQWLGLTGTLTPIIVTHLVITVPIVVWVMIGFFEGLPAELEEAAQIDGCSKIGAFARVTFPLVAPGLISTGVFAFIQAWNEFVLALVVMEGNKTLPIWLRALQEATKGTDWGTVMAGSTLISIPVVIFFLFVQGRMTSGMVSGAVKG